ncbi:hypothetical protein U1769_13045 [Sphingomonas sp. ZT3P38]|uniref:hypothetical protein n=1 Tax=Parasphingomonas zepuensis TaxID=3096161 RepID=UPI002FCBA309
MAEDGFNTMRILSHILLALAAVVVGCAILAYLYLTNLACGYAPGASSCRAWPWNLGSDDRFWLVGLPSAVVAALIAIALFARRKACQRRDREGGR